MKHLACILSVIFCLMLSSCGVFEDVNSCLISWGSSDMATYCEEHESDEGDFPPSCIEESKKEGESCADQGHGHFCDEGDGVGFWVPTSSDCQRVCYSGADYPFCK